jgi:hypothetical protein
MVAQRFALFKSIKTLKRSFNYGKVRAFDFYSGKIRYASRLETASVVKIETENGTVLWIKSKPLL